MDALEVRADTDAFAVRKGVDPCVFRLDELESVVEEIQLVRCRREAR
jgi:hypothetical protein